MIRTFRGKTPQIAPSAYVDHSAQVIGDVVIGERSSIWPNVTLRGDVHSLRIGAETNIQDNSVLHADYPDFPLTLGDRVTVGHLCMLHGCTVEDDALIGIGAIVLNGARIGQGAVIAAGAVVAEGAEIPAFSLVMGVPGKVRREVNEEERARFRSGAEHYVELGQQYPPLFRGVESRRGRGSGSVPGLQLPGDPDANFRRDPVVLPRRGRGHRHRHQGDVHLRRP
jgi:carbonic anhydrase/acetyltransferase-like protein (isoleucine patch superfamily)